MAAPSSLDTSDEYREDEILFNFLTDSSNQSWPAVLKKVSGLDQITADAFWNSRSASKKSKGSAPYRAWVRRLIPNSSNPFPEELLQRNVYWLLILEGLSGISSEIQKYCIYILKQSINLVRNDFKNEIVSKTSSSKQELIQLFDRYCGVYEIILFAKYTNQVEECLKVIPSNLLQPRNSPSGIDESWWFALFIASFEARNAANVQGLVGRWILSLECTSLAPTTQFKHLLLNQFLRWACQGTLFFQSLSRNGRIVHCEHGDQLSQFISKLLRGLVDDESRKNLTRDILKALKSDTSQEYAIAFVLTGMNLYISRDSSEQSSKPMFKPQKNAKYFNNLSENPTIGAVIEYHMSYILDTVGPMESQPIENAEDTVNFSPVEFKASGTIPSLQSLLDNSYNVIRKTNSIPLFCQRVLEVVQSNPIEESDHSPLLALFNDLWTIFSRHRHSKPMAEAVLPIYFSKPVLEQTKINQDLQSFIRTKFQELLKLANTKIQIWNPLCLILREKYGDIEDLSDILPLSDIFLQLATKPPSPPIATLLDCAVSQIIIGYPRSEDLVVYADETYGHACVFDIMNRLRERDFGMGLALLKKLMRPWMKNSKRLGSNPAPENLRGISKFQTMLILSRKCVEEGDELQEFRRLCLNMLGQGINPIFRYIVQWMFLATFWNDSSFNSGTEYIFEEIMKCMDEEVSPKLVASLIRIGSYLSQYRPASGKPAWSFAGKFIDTLPMFCSSDKAGVRHEAQWTVPLMMHQVQSDLQNAPELESVRINRSFALLYKQITSLKKYKNPPEQWTLGEFDPYVHQNLLNLYQGRYLGLDMLFWHGPTRQDLELLSRQPNNKLPAPSIPLFPDQMLERSLVINLKSKPNAAPTSEPSSVPIQSKGAVPMDMSETAEQAVPTVPIILVGSLIDSDFNLGGLCRLSNIYSIQSLHLASKSVITTSAFLSTAVSSTPHVQIEETTAEDLTSFIHQKKQEGWKIVGVEQTDSSLILGDEKLPDDRIVLIMGAEKTGIPGEILSLCDLCVEIRQWGVTRSLNVQTAAATVLFEIRRQWGN